MKGLISAVIIAVFAWVVIALFLRAYRWAFRRQGKLFTLEANELNEAADEVAKTAKLVAFGGIAASSFAAPTGLAAIGVKLGFVAAPLIVVIAPHLTKLAGAIFLACCAVSLYAKLLRRRAKRTLAQNPPA